MKSYSKPQFESINLERQLTIMLTTIQEIESKWGDDKVSGAINLLKDYFQWIDFYNQENDQLKRLAQFQFSINPEMSLRQLLDLAVPIERYLNLSIKDEHIVPVREGDMSIERKTYPLYFVLDHLRSAFNVGSLFRTAECLGIEHIYLVGYTPTPDDQGVKKTSMRTDSLVSWSSHFHLEEVKNILTEKGISLIALETSEGSRSLYEFNAPESLALLVGNERFGLSQESLKLSDDFIEIPMEGNKNSMNVANCLSVSAFEVIRQWKK